MRANPIAGFVVRSLDRVMSDETAAFISELLRAANEVTKLTMPERARVLLLAAATIRDCKDEIDPSEVLTNETGGLEDVVFFLNEAAGFVEQFSDDELAETILEAVETIMATQIVLEQKRKIERGE